MISDKETKKILFVRFFYCRPVANLKESSDLKGASRLLLHSRVTKVYKSVGDGRALYGLLYNLMRRIVRYYVLFLAIANRFMNFLIVVIGGLMLLALEGSSIFSRGLVHLFSRARPIFLVGISTLRRGSTRFPCLCFTNPKKSSNFVAEFYTR